jgi:predicted Zn-ribbon and HTH transcriptional regulator
VLFSRPRCPPGSASTRPPLELADVVRHIGDSFRRGRALSREQERALSDIVRCRTAELGGHKDVCQECGFERPAYNSCRNRHCPKCQALEAARWLERRRARILPVHYFHVVFTLPAELRPLARENRALVFDAMFHAAGEALCELGRDSRRIGAQLGVTAVLHTWTRELQFHPHIHCVVTGGGLSLDGERWVATRPDFLLPVRVLGALFRGKLLAMLADARVRGELRAAPEPAAWQRLMAKLYRLRWNTYVKPPFGGPEQVFAYLGRYTHRVALSNYRLLSFDERGVRFRTRGDGQAILSAEEFLARFVEHVLPPGFVKIRHYGLHSASHATTRLEQARALLCAAAPSAAVEAPQLTGTAPVDWRDLARQLTELDLTHCPNCCQQTLVRIALVIAHGAEARAPPERMCA